MSDERLRALERAAALGDPRAQKELDKAKIRRGEPVVFQVTNSDPDDERAPYHGKTFEVVLYMDDRWGSPDELLVRVFDAKYKGNKFPDWTEHGQFVSEYYASTLLEHPFPDRGLNLYGGEPKWQLDVLAKREILDRIEGLPGTEPEERRKPKGKGRKRRKNGDEDLRALERAAVEGGVAEMTRYLAALSRVGKSPRELGDAAADVVARRPGKKKPARWVQLLRILGQTNPPTGTGIRSVDDAKRVDKLMAKVKSVWETVDGYEEEDPTYYPFDTTQEHNVEAVMKEIDALLGTFGVEHVQSEYGNGPGGYWRDTLALYCNTGDGYDTTVCYDVREDEFVLREPNTFVEEDDLERNEDGEDDS